MQSPAKCNVRSLVPTCACFGSEISGRLDPPRSTRYATDILTKALQHQMPAFLKAIELRIASKAFDCVIGRNILSVYRLAFMSIVAKSDLKVLDVYL